MDNITGIGFAGAGKMGGALLEGRELSAWRKEFAGVCKRVRSKAVVSI